MLVLLCFVVAVLIIAWFVMKDVNTPLADKLSDKLSAHTKKVEEVIAPVSYTHLTLPTNREV